MLVCLLLLADGQRGLVVLFIVTAQSSSGHHLRVHVETADAALRCAVFFCHPLMIIHIAVVEVLDVGC